MSESFPPPPEQQPHPEPEQTTQFEQPAAEPAKSAGAARLVPRGKGARWAALGAAVVLVGGGTAALAALAVSGHHRDGHAVRFEVREGGPQGPHKAGPEGMGKGGRPEGMGKHREGLPGGPEGRGPGGPRKAAPAPLPSLAIGDAVEKAAAAVTGGKVEGIRVVGQEGGGSAWRAVVVGPDGVRHAVTVSGADGAITGNVVLSGR
ncbi:hypothetical protein ACFXB3_13830 [Streptomyces sp. NPDC059447]|uniref:hypothetical protein n=1 Tax=Streptomyces sp. NPDC059447 TaxID=3346834 RepID=UPI0036B8D07A